MFRHYTHFHEAKINVRHAEGRGQMPEAEDNSSRLSPMPRTKFWPRGQLVLGDWMWLCCWQLTRRIMLLTEWLQVLRL